MRSAITVAGILGTRPTAGGRPARRRRHSSRPGCVHRTAAHRSAPPFSPRANPVRRAISFDRYALGSVQPTDLRPIVHAQHALPPSPSVQQGSENPHVQWWIPEEGVDLRPAIAGQYSAVTDIASAHPGGGTAGGSSEPPAWRTVPVRRSDVLASRPRSRTASSTCAGPGDGDPIASPPTWASRPPRCTGCSCAEA